MSWNYADLSKTAKNCGGPEELVDRLVNTGIAQGRESMYPIVGLALVVGALAWEGGKALWKRFYNKGVKSCSEIDIQATRDELIQGIKDYDSKQSIASKMGVNAICTQSVSQSGLFGFFEDNEGGK